MTDGILQPGMPLSLDEGIAVGAAGIDHPGGIAELEGADAALEELEQGGAFASGAAERVHGGDQQDHNDADAGVDENELVRFEAKHRVRVWRRVRRPNEW